MVRIFLDKCVQGKDSRRGRHQRRGAIGNADVRVANRDRAMGNFKSILFGAIAALATVQPTLADPSPSETPAQTTPATPAPETAAAPTATGNLVTSGIRL